MKNSLLTLALAASLCASGASFGQAAAATPSGSTGLCKDGSYTSNAIKNGACAGHKGVKDWYAASTATAAIAPVPAKAIGSASAPGTASARAAATPGPGGAGQVWVNSSSKVYHCEGTKYYGKTRQGEYMTEAVAKAAGNHADHGKSCS